MSGIWAECKKHDKAIQSMVTKQRKRAVRKRKREQENTTNPFANICISAQPATIIRSTTLHEQQNSTNTLIPWNVDPSVLIDRFDVRELLTEKPKILKTAPLTTERVCSP